MLALTLALALAAPPRIAVMPVAGDALSERSAASLTDQLAAEVRRQGGGEVLTPRDIPAALTSDKLRLSQGCATDPGMAEAASAIGADRLVVAEVSKLGDSLLLHSRVLDSRSVRALSIADRRFRRGALDDLLDALPGVVGELLRGAEGVAPPADKLVLHYHREDGRYEASLYTWQSFETGADLRRSAPVSIDSRVPTVEPDGHDDFGVLWIIPASRFRNGRVNFQIQQGGAWDECVRISYKPTNPVHYSAIQPDLGPAQFWLLSDGREAWINVPECEIHATLDRALKGQRRRPRGK